MEFKSYTENGRVPVTVLQVEGDIDSSTYDSFETKANNLVDEGARYLLLDLTHSRFISSAGFRSINKIFNKLRSMNPESNLNTRELKEGINAGTYKSPHIKLLNLSDESRIAFELAGFNLFIETHTDLKTAIASF